MANKPNVSKEPEKKKKDAHPGMMGDGTEEQNLNQPGNPGARIKQDEADAAFSHKEPPSKSK
jgi:hypothetical protein